jgi:hypothetical protein
VAELTGGWLCVVEGGHTLNFSRAPEIARLLSDFIRGADGRAL